MNPLQIHIPTKDERPAFEEVVYYYATEKGWMVNMPTLFGIGHTELDGVPPTLPTSEARFNLNDRRFPAELMQQAHMFFKAVWDKQKTESSLYIFYHRSSDSFKLWAPEQYVTGTSVNHRLNELPDGFTPAGTIHSHCNFSAFHSGTDQHDMEGMPGLHITIGHVDRVEPEYAIALSLGDSQFDVDYDAIIEDTNPPTCCRTYPTHWMGFVKKGNAPWGKSGVTTNYKPTPVYGKKWVPQPVAPSTFKPGSHIQHDWDKQAWGNEDDWGQYAAFINSHEPTKAVGSEDKFAQTFEEGTDAPSDVWNYYKEDLADWQYTLSLLGDQMAEIGFDFDWSVQWNPSHTQEKMFDDAPTP